MSKFNKFLTVVIIFVLLFSLAACNDENGNGGNQNDDGKYTIIWKNNVGFTLQTDTDVARGTMPTYNGTTPKKPGTGNFIYVFDGWTPAVAPATADVTYTAKFREIDLTKGNAGVDAVFSADLTTVQYGLYPQTHVSDSDLVEALNALSPTQTNGWYLHDGTYYAKQTATVFNNETYVFDDGASIVNGTEYWFRCEPITWLVLSGANGQYYLLAQNILDAHNFYEDYAVRTADNNTIYANNYEHSSVRAWLNGEFFDTAFALGGELVAQTSAYNGGGSVDILTNPYGCATTVEKVYLPSNLDYTNAGFGFEQDGTKPSATRQSKTTDYARARGVWCNVKTDLGEGTLYNGTYWTRSATSQYDYCAWVVNSAGVLSAYAVDGNYHGIRPCVMIQYNQN